MGYSRDDETAKNFYHSGHPPYCTCRLCNKARIARQEDEAWAERERQSKRMRFPSIAHARSGSAQKPISTFRLMLWLASPIILVAIAIILKHTVL